MKWYVLQEEQGKRSLVQLKNKIKIGKQRAKLNPHLKLGQLYQISKGKILPSESVQIDIKESGNNSQLYDRSTAQKLDHDSITQIKQQQGGNELISELVSNSESFNHRTSFSQQKYIQRKQQKQDLLRHLSLFRILPASTADIANVLFEMNPMKFIKGETLSALIYLSNIHHDSNTLVIDYNHGILVASALQRCLIPIQFYSPHKPSAIKYFGIPNIQDKLITRENLDDVSEGINCLIASGVADVQEILQRIFQKMNPGASFAIHSDDIVSVGQGMDWIIKGGFGVNLQLEEVWSRWIQVAENRTHPILPKGHGGYYGGFVLSGIKV